MKNDIEQLFPLVQQINDIYNKLQYLSNDKFRCEVKKIESEITTHKNNSKQLHDYLPRVYAIVKETARRFSCGGIIVTANDNDKYLAKKYDFVVIEGERAIYKNRWDVGERATQWNMIHYDEQLMGGILLHYGYAVEMATGEGKTLVATLPVFLNALTHKGVHLMTVNEYLSKRDFQMTRPIYMFHGLSADCIEYYKHHDQLRKNAYGCNIIFGTHSSFIFDYLSDHIAVNPEQCVQRNHNYAIVDELDSIFIDDASTPHIVGGGNFYNSENIYKENLPIIQELLEIKGKTLYEVNLLDKSAHFNTTGKLWLSEKKKINDLYSIERKYEIGDYDTLPEEKQKEFGEKLDLQLVFHNLLLAHTVYKKDVDYVVDEKIIKIIDQNTGRIKEKNRWQHGLHTAIEVKENVKVQDEFDGMAVISIKNYFRLYNKTSGMSGTIMPVENELAEAYGMRCAKLPTHKPLIRKDEPMRIFRTSACKNKAIVNAVLENYRQGRPTLIGSISVKRSDEIASLLNECKIEFNKLDAKNTKEEAFIISKAGQGNTITVSTSIAGRGTDIKPSDDAIFNGGLMVVGTDLFDSVRVDRQLKGRSGRQGNPGTSVSFASLDDFILKNLSEADRLALKQLADSVSGDELSNPAIRDFFELAQANRENSLKEQRKYTEMKDDIVAPQRKKFYSLRNAALFNAEEAEIIISEILKASKVKIHDINNNIDGLYLKVKELIMRSLRNSPHRQKIYAPFSESLQPFAILLDVDLTKTAPSYFEKEFKRQVILQTYDKFWKDFVLHMMSNLDERETKMLDIEYNKMMVKINSAIINRLCKSTIPFEMRNGMANPENEIAKPENPTTPPVKICPNAPCPCGSGKGYSTCHGSNIHKRTRNKRRH